MFTNLKKDKISTGEPKKNIHVNSEEQKQNKAQKQSPVIYSIINVKPLIFHNFAFSAPLAQKLTSGLFTHT